eukprot:1677590-Rhodomonas_salina.1
MSVGRVCDAGACDACGHGAGGRGGDSMCVGTGSHTVAVQRRVLVYKGETAVLKGRRVVKEAYFVHVENEEGQAQVDAYPAGGDSSTGSDWSEVEALWVWTQLRVATMSSFLVRVFHEDAGYAFDFIFNRSDEPLLCVGGRKVCEGSVPATCEHTDREGMDVSVLGIAVSFREREEDNQFVCEGVCMPSAECIRLPVKLSFTSA